MKSIKIAGKKFKLASRLTRLYAFFIDVALIGAAQSVLAFFLSLVAVLFLHQNSWSIGIGFIPFVALFSLALWIFGLFLSMASERGRV